MAGRLSVSDPNSFSQPEICVVKRIHLNLTVNFALHLLSGSIDLSVEKKSKTESKSLVLDTKDLTIEQITNAVTGATLDYTLGEPVESFGSKLEVILNDPDTECMTVRIKYKTSSEASALQWLAPEQTAGKKHPYLFSQCQAIHARSIMPCQDTPAVKAPYTAEIRAPAELVVLMSAVRNGTEADASNSTLTVHRFEQKVPIPSYLTAIVVGALESRKIGPRSHVWSEKELVDKAAYEFAETEEMLKAGEDVLSPYIWGVYDLIVLPPSFPFGGMENPCITFVTPTLLAGDRSLASVIAHEIAHSWTGNLVTNANWEHFWLNEGHTVYLERKIAARMAGETERHFEAVGGWKDLQAAVDSFSPGHAHTHLVPDLTGVDPDDAFSAVPYEKGFTLLFYLETLLGGAEVFEAWLRHYVNHFQYKSLTTDEWRHLLYDYFADKKDLLDSVDWDAWLYAPGMPPVQPNYDLTLADACVSLSRRWLEAPLNKLDQFSGDDVKTMNSRQLRELLALLLVEEPLPIAKLEAMDTLYGFSAMMNAEIRFRWLRLGLRARWQRAVGPALHMVTEQGRMKFTRPLYRDLFAWEESRARAVATFEKNKGFMHSTTAGLVAKDLESNTPK
ncbi:PREDICTED: leukotriene A-4 hydrolase-like [Priapulus caudatus]|uniref:Leukotriene A(4) hydrolase n=1 Tax=Priapulus caudatus TaxID=37621 RepID=A0ABM1EK01_PRICU|nr:PREDICTED: leukotriene A-4 hydrolase-like [Priapulus caudatus]